MTGSAASGSTAERQITGLDGDADSPFDDFDGQRRIALRRVRIERSLLLVVFVAAFVASARIGEISVSSLREGLGEAADYLARMLPPISPSAPIDGISNWYWGFETWSRELMSTISIAFVSTTIGTVLAIPLSFVASRSLTEKHLYFVVRRLLELMRTIPTLVYALSFVLAFGLGATAGILAIAVHTTSSLGKLFSEVNETVDPKPAEAVRAAGGGWISLVRFAVFPQVVPAFISYVLLRLEKNVRSATVIGFVGAGGIGQELYVAIRTFQYQDVSAIAIMIILLVMITDLVCEQIRRRVM